MYLGHCVPTSVFLVKAVLHLRYLQLFLSSDSALLLASPSSAGKIIKKPSRSHDLLLTMKAECDPVFLMGETYPIIGKVAVLGEESQRMWLYILFHQLSSTMEIPLQCL